MNGEIPARSERSGIHYLELQEFLQLLVSRRPLEWPGLREHRETSAYSRSVFDRETGELYVVGKPPVDATLQHSQ